MHTAPRQGRGFQVSQVERLVTNEVCRPEPGDLCLSRQAYFLICLSELCKLMLMVNVLIRSTHRGTQAPAAFFCHQEHLVYLRRNDSWDQSRLLKIQIVKITKSHKVFGKSVITLEIFPNSDIPSES